jgi:hypothetical protein
MRGVLDTPLCDMFSDLRHVDTTPISCTNKTDRHDITEILLKMALETITMTVANIESVCVNLYMSYI